MSVASDGIDAAVEEITVETLHQTECLPSRPDGVERGRNVVRRAVALTLAGALLLPLGAVGAHADSGKPPKNVPTLPLNPSGNTGGGGHGGIHPPPGALPTFTAPILNPHPDLGASPTPNPPLPPSPTATSTPKPPPIGRTPSPTPSPSPSPSPTSTPAHPPIAPRPPVTSTPPASTPPARPSPFVPPGQTINPIDEKDLPGQDVDFPGSVVDVIGTATPTATQATEAGASEPATPAAEVAETASETEATPEAGAEASAAGLQVMLDRGVGASYAAGETLEITYAVPTAMPVEVALVLDDRRISLYRGMAQGESTLTIAVPPTAGLALVEIQATTSDGSTRNGTAWFRVK